MYKIFNGNNLDLLDSLEDNSIDSIVTDGPYGLKFMNKKWDYDVPSIDFWRKVFRVLKPGGHILSFGGTRTYHRMVVNLEDAGFEIRDCISWIYGSGFPKSLNIGKNYDKKIGNHREVVSSRVADDIRSSKGGWNPGDNKGLKNEIDITKGQSEYEGLGTALKPAQELICLARKPLSESSIVENVIKWGTGGLNIDGCRIEGEYKGRKEKNLDSDEDYFRSDLLKNRGEFEPHSQGRFPANIILECICDEVIKGDIGEMKKSGGSRENCDLSHEWGYINIVRTNYTDKGDIHTNPECPCKIMDEQSGQSKSQSGISSTNISQKNANWYRTTKSDVEERWGFGDRGGASRFFYVAKVSKKERNLGLDEFEDRTIHDEYNKYGLEKFNTKPKKNYHPTCKPINLLTYLCRLVTPKGGVILDPYMGSGSTGISSQLEGFNFIGFELDPDYFRIAEERLSNWEEYKSILKNSQD